MGSDGCISVFRCTQCTKPTRGLLERSFRSDHRWGLAWGLTKGRGLHKRTELALHWELLKIEHVGVVNQGTVMNSALILYKLESCI